MYQVSVPVMNENVTAHNRLDVLHQLKRFDAKRVFLALDGYEFDTSKQNAVFARLKENCAFFKENGLEVGAWNWVFGIGKGKGFGHLRSLSGGEYPTRACPADGAFIHFCREYMKKIAACGVDLIMFDDDFTCEFIVSDTPGCLCDRHIAMINQTVGEENDRPTLTARILKGGKNKYRDAFLKANGDSLRAFSKAMREAVDEIDPNIRIGGCTAMASWDIDGTTPDELARILAGKNKPFYRLIGAPYWSVRNSFGCSLQDVVELERMESAWTRAEDVEIFAEGDVFPRPRYNCPASYLEGFDTAIRAAGCTDGILKYGIDYTSQPDYEKGYARFHERNRELYRNIEEMFGNKKHCGIRVYESMKKTADMEMESAVHEKGDFRAVFWPESAKMLAHNAIPTTYEGDGVCGIVFDESARSLSLSALKNGMIIDLAAAEILMKRGVDVGIRKIGAACQGAMERNLNTGNKICHYFTPVTVYQNEFNEKIQTLSVLETEKGDVPLSYLYKNKAGEQFLVFNLNSRAADRSKYRNSRFGTDNVFYNYERGRQIAEFVALCSGEKLPAHVYGCPDMYLQCKESDGKLAVGLWNFFADEAFETVVQLKRAYSKIRFLNCNGTLLDDRVIVDSIPAFGYAFFEVEI